MNRDQLLAKLRSHRDAAASRGDHAEALIVNDRIKDLKAGGPSAEAVERAMQHFESSLSRRRFYVVSGSA